ERSRRRPWAHRGRDGEGAPRRAASAWVAGGCRPSVDDCDLDRRDRGQVARDLAPTLPVVRTRVHLAGTRAEVVAGRVVRGARPPPAPAADVRILLRGAVRQTLPTRTRVLRPPDRRSTVGHRAA